MESDTLLVTYFKAGETPRSGKLDTIVLQDGKFFFDVPNATEPMEVAFVEKPSSKPNADGSLPAASMKSISLLLLPGEAVELTGNFDEYQLKGSDFYKACNEVAKEEAKYIEQMNALSAEVQELIQKQLSGVSEDSVRKAAEPYQKKMEDLYGQFFNVKKEYIKNHPGEEVSVYFLANLPWEYAKDVMDLITDDVKNGRMGSYYKLVQQAKEDNELREKATENIQPGKEAPDFTLKDLNGNDFTLSSLKGKYVVLDFWGSWCSWCIKGFPEMKKSYEKHKGKVEFVGIDCNDTEEKWKKAVEEQGLPWIHVRNAGEPDLSALYGVPGYPTKIIIDKEGKINKIVVGEDPEFYSYLDELLK